MNRDQIPKGRTQIKFTECLSLFGGAGAIIYPPIFYYNGYMSVVQKDDFLFCEYSTIGTKETAGEDYSDNVRNAMLLNGIMMALYLLLHFYLFSRPETSNAFKTLGVFYTIVLVLGLITSVISIVMVGNSICNDGKVATSVYVSSFAIIVVNLVTLVGALIFFFCKTANKDAKVAVADGSERSSLVEDANKTNSVIDSSQVKKEATPVKQEEEDDPGRPPAKEEDEEDY